MRKFLFTVFAVLFVLWGLSKIDPPGYAETYRLSGSNIYLTVPNEDSVTAVHLETISLKKSVTKDSTNIEGTITDVHGLQVSVKKDSTNTEGVITDVHGIQVSVTADSTRLAGVKTDVDGLQVSVAKDSTNGEGIITDVHGLQVSVAKDSTNGEGIITDVHGLQVSATKDSTNGETTMADAAAIETDVHGLQVSVTKDSTNTEGVITDVHGVQVSITADSTQNAGIVTDVHGLQVSATKDSINGEGIITDVHGLQVSATTDSTTNEATNAVADKIVAATGVLFEQADVPINVTAIADSGTTVLNLRALNTRYLVRNLRIKSADPNPNTVTVKLYEFINDAFVTVDTFAITTANYTTYFGLYDMFSVVQLAGDNLWITVETDAGTAAVTGQFSYAKTNN
jgi:hypothetical protein